MHADTGFNQICVTCAPVRCSRHSTPYEVSVSAVPYISANQKAVKIHYPFKKSKQKALELLQFVGFSREKIYQLVKNLNLMEFKYIRSTCRVRFISVDTVLYIY